MKLSLKIIRSYNLPERTYKPDWDDTYIEFTLPNGIVLETPIQLNNESCKSDSLEGLDGYIYIETKEELDEILNMSYEGIINKISSENDDFNSEEYL